MRELVLSPDETRLYLTTATGPGNVTVCTLNGSGDIPGTHGGSPFGGASGAFGLALNPASGIHRLYVADQSNSHELSTLTLDGSGNITGPGTRLVAACGCQLF